MFQIVDRPLNQLGTVIGGNDLHAFRHGRLDLRQLRLHALDNIERILAMAHDHNPADDITVAIEIGHAAPDLRPERDIRYVTQQSPACPPWLS